MSRLRAAAALAACVSWPALPQEHNGPGCGVLWWQAGRGLREQARSHPWIPGAEHGELPLAAEDPSPSSRGEEQILHYIAGIRTPRAKVACLPIPLTFPPPIPPPWLARASTFS